MSTPLDTPVVSSDSFNQAVLAWFDQHGRKNLPWQHNRTPYRVWVSEIMLQQTQVATVIPYYERFMQRFGSLDELANAPIDDVLSLWAGLGYYARGRNLHKAAKQVIENFNGRFPEQQNELETLSGIGRSTAAAICSLAYDQPATIMDGNVKRVLTRVQGIHEWPGQTNVTQALWQLAEHYTPTHRNADYTQAMMDLGATLCTRSKPDCERCPLQSFCVAFQQNQQHSIPASKPKSVKPEKYCWMLYIENENKEALLQKRPPSGIWGGLWSLPEVDHNVTLEALELHTKTNLGIHCEIENVDDSFRHTFSHYHLHISPVRMRLVKHSSDTPSVQESNNQWFSREEIVKTGLPAPVKRIVESHNA